MADDILGFKFPKNRQKWTLWARSNDCNSMTVSADALYSLRKFSFCRIYAVIVGNLFYRLSYKKVPYAVCGKASKPSKTVISKRRTLGKPFDFAQT